MLSVPCLNKELEFYDFSATNNDCSGNKRHPNITKATINTRIWTSSLFFIADQCERKRRELVTIALIELVLVLHPMEPQGMKECT